MSRRLIGPFDQILPMTGLPLKGALKDQQLNIIEDGGIIVNDGKIEAIGLYDNLKSANPEIELEVLKFAATALPAFVDSHTHLCFDGSRSMDFAERNAGTSYQDIAAAGGGIWSSVKHTRAASKERLVALMLYRSKQLIKGGVGTVEVKSGYGLSVAEEMKMLEAIAWFNRKSPLDVISTCLAAHIIPKDIEGGESAHLKMILDELVPKIKAKDLCNRFDIFIEENAFSTKGATKYLSTLKSMGFELTVHGDQFSVGGSQVAIEVGARSVDHLEVSGEKEISALARSNVIATALPGASIGIGCPFTPARKLLDAGAALAIASDWNPGSAPMGNLLTQASILATFEKLTTAEVLSAITFRAAAALNLNHVGTLDVGCQADIICFPTRDYRDVLYHQGSMEVVRFWKRGSKL